MTDFPEWRPQAPESRDPAAQARAEAWVRGLALSAHHSPEFRKSIAAVQALGSHAQQRSTQVGRSLLDRPAPPLTAELTALRQILAPLLPTPPNWWQRLWKPPASPELTPQLYIELTAQVRPSLEGLYRSQDELRRQQAALSSELKVLDGVATELEQAAELAAELDRLLEASLPELERRQPLHAAAVRDEALLAVRSRRQDLTEALTTTAQARLALTLAHEQAGQLQQQVGRTAEGVVTALTLARKASRAAELRARAAQAGEQLAQAQEDLQGAQGPEDLNAALHQAFAALDDLERLEAQAERAAAP